MNRQSLLSAVLVASTSLSGCVGEFDVGPDTSVELSIETVATEDATVEWRAISTEGTVGFEYEQVLQPAGADDVGEVEVTHRRFEGSLDGRTPIRHEYSPPYSEPCGDKELQLVVDDRDARFVYFCSH